MEPFHLLRGQDVFQPGADFFFQLRQFPVLFRRQIQLLHGEGRNEVGSTLRPLLATRTAHAQRAAFKLLRATTTPVAIRSGTSRTTGRTTGTRPHITRATGLIRSAEPATTAGRAGRLTGIFVSTRTRAAVGKAGRTGGVGTLIVILGVHAANHCAEGQAHQKNFMFHMY